MVCNSVEVVKKCRSGKCLIGLTHCPHLPDLLSDRQERDFDSSGASTIKIQLSMLLQYKVDIIIIQSNVICSRHDSAKKKIKKKLALNNYYSLIHICLMLTTFLNYNNNDSYYQLEPNHAKMHSPYTEIFIFMFVNFIRTYFSFIFI